MEKKVLIINPFGIGDVLFSTPLVQAIRRKYPQCYIAYICNIKTEEILKTNPALNEVFVFERDDYRKLWKISKRECVKKFVGFWAAVKNRGFDVVFDLSLGKEYAFFCWLVGIKERKGFNYKRRGLFLNYKIPFYGFNDKPVAEYYLSLIGSSERFSTVLLPTEEDFLYIDKFLKGSGIKENELLVGVAPGGGAAFGREKEHYKRWPHEKFAELILRFNEFAARTILFWGPSEEDVVRNIKKDLGGNALIGPKTTIRQMAALMKRCKLVICNDGGMLHIAVSQDTPTVSIFGPTDEHVYGPYPMSAKHVVVKSEIDCRPCYRRFRLQECSDRKCMDDVSVEKVFNAARKFIEAIL